MPLPVFPNLQNNANAALPVYLTSGSGPPITVSSSPYLYTPIGYQQITSLATATNLTVPSGATIAVIAVEGAAVRYRDDGTSPTASIGMPLAIGAELIYQSALSAIQFIQQSSGAILNISYYK